jgi:hypothetical protein
MASDVTSAAPVWRARGLIFENCSCTLVCPGHVHFSQQCTHERCVGYWALRFDEGVFDDVSLSGLRALVVFDSPQTMIDGNWTERLIIDESASPDQRRALGSILTGQAGGPWQVLDRFVRERLETRFLPIAFEDEGATKRASIAGLFTALVTQIRGRDRSRPVVFENIFNQIHAPTQVLALGETQYDDGVIRIHTSKTHGLFSTFDWSVGGH